MVDLKLLGEVWDTVLCCENHGVRYSEVFDNKQILDRFNPVVTDIRHMKFSNKFGRDLGGIMLGDVMQYISRQVDRYITANGCPSWSQAGEKLSSA